MTKFIMNWNLEIITLYYIYVFIFFFFSGTTPWYLFTKMFHHWHNINFSFFTAIYFLLFFGGSGISSGLSLIEISIQQVWLFAISKRKYWLDQTKLRSYCLLISYLLSYTGVMLHHLFSFSLLSITVTHSIFSFHFCSLLHIPFLFFMQELFWK